MEKKYDNMVENLRKMLDNMSEKEKEEIKAKYFPEDTTPKGWLSIEDHLPMVTMGDIEKNDGIFKIVKVKDKDGNEFGSRVGDHHIWYYMAKDGGITHWYNE